MTIAIGFAITGLALVLFIWWITQSTRREHTWRLAERAVREEFEAYARLDATLAPGEPARDLARRAAAAVAKHSAFGQCALLLRNAEQRLHVVGSAGIDDLLLRALDAWGDRFAREQKQQPQKETRRRSYPITVGPLEAFDATRKSGILGCRQVIILPLWSNAAEKPVMLGALAVTSSAPEKVSLDLGLPPLEALALMLARSIENATLSDRLLRAEKLAGLGQLAKGVAHELNNPLTAVLGFAELIAETSTEHRIAADAHAIITQALRMKETVESLTNFARPVSTSDTAVSLDQLLQTLAAKARPELHRRGVQLILQIDDTIPVNVHGHPSRLTELFEHLLNNAARAIADYAAPAPLGPDPRTLRITLSRERKTVQVVVSDTGAGFANPARVFDPFFTTRQPGEGAGMGLAISYGIVREHGGEICAFNLSPHGAAVVVELPLARILRESGEHAIAVS